MFYMNDDNLPEIKEIFKQIMDQPDKMFDMLRMNLRKTCEAAVTELIKAELTEL